jgi:hypothetical protein
MRDDYERVLRAAHEKRAAYMGKALRARLSAISDAAARASAALAPSWRAHRRPAPA